MGIGGTRKLLNSAAPVLLVGIIAVCVASPFVISIGSDKISVATSDVNAASRDSVKVVKPTALGSSQIITIEQGILFAADASGRPLDGLPSQTQLARGDTRFVAEGAVLRLQSGQKLAAADVPSPILDAITNLQFEALTLRQATVHVALPDGRVETVTRIDGEVTNRRRGLLLTGRGDLRGQRMDFEVAFGVVTDLRPGTLTPLKLSIKSGSYEMSFDGRAGFSGPPQLQGDVEFSMPSVRRFARWLGASWPAGNGLINLVGRGRLEWAGPAITFSQGTFAVDGNEATGSLHIKFAEPRPFIGGTLALKTLDVGRYFQNTASATASVGGTSSPWSSLLGTDVSLPLTQHFDADLRISADKVRLGAFQLGRAAASVTVSQGRMLADVAAFEFDGGRGSGQITADTIGGFPKLSIRGRLDEIDAARATTSLFGHPVLAGRATITTEISGLGRTAETFMQTSNGRLNVTIRNGGRLGVDLRGLAVNVQKQRSVEGWGSAGRGQNAFDEFDGTFVVRAGALIAEGVKARAGELSTIFTGMIELSTSRLTGGITQFPTLVAPTNIANRPALALAQPSPAFSLLAVGPWGKPIIRVDGAHDRSAEEPTAIFSVPPARM